MHLYAFPCYVPFRVDSRRSKMNKKNILWYYSWFALSHLHIYSHGLTRDAIVRLAFRVVCQSRLNLAQHIN